MATPQKASFLLNFFQNTLKKVFLRLRKGLFDRGTGLMDWGYAGVEGTMPMINMEGTPPLRGEPYPTL
jgi:hypothetical protein